MQTVGRWLTKRAHMHPERVALRVPDERGQYVSFTYAELKGRTRRLHEALAGAGLTKGDRVAVLSYNCPQFVELLFAAAEAGFIVVPLNVRLSAAEWRYQLRDSGARLLLLGPEFARWKSDLLQGTSVKKVAVMPTDPLAEAAPAVAEIRLDGRTRPEAEGAVELNDPFIICYTSGTTGSPKGAVLTQGNQLANALNACMTLDISGRDTAITLLPMFHAGGIGLFTLPTLYAGGTVVLPRQFDAAETLKLIESFRVSVVFAVPTIHQAIADDPGFEEADLSSVRWFYSGGAPCPLPLIDVFRRRGIAFGQGYGLTETSPTHFLLVPEDFERGRGTIGRPALHAEARVVDEKGRTVPPGTVGEIVVAGPNVFKEYWGRPEETAASFKDGWFYTGDLGRCDEDGFVTVVGRRKELIISGGENIYPVEVEQLLESHPDVAEAAVVGLPDARWGESPHAAVVARVGADLSPAALADWCREKIAKYKVPKSFWIAPELPRNAAGKVVKSDVVAALERMRDGAGAGN